MCDAALKAGDRVIAIMEIACPVPAGTRGVVTFVRERKDKPTHYFARWDNGFVDRVVAEHVAKDLQ
jgi:hypothetical protein